MKGQLILFFLACNISLATTALSQEWSPSAGLLEEAITVAHSNFTRSYSSQLLKNYSNVAQDTSSTVLVVTTDGNEIVGQLLEETSVFIRVKTEIYGELTIQRSNIKSIKYVNQKNIRAGVLWKDHMQSTRYFWQPNGYGLKKGEAYYQNVWVFFNQFSVGVTDNILLGGGIIPLFLIAGSPTPVWITPKVSFPVVKNKVNIGVGGLFATVLGEEDLNLGIAYGSATFGPRDKNLTLGIGYGYAGGDWSSRPTFSANFLSRVGARGYFILENYIIELDSQYGVLSIIGGRSIIGRDAGLDYGLVVPFFPDMGTFIAFPWLGVTVPLGSKK